MTRLIFPATLQPNRAAMARHALDLTRFIKANTHLDMPTCRRLGLQSARDVAERELRFALGIAPLQVAQACERIATAALTEAERRVWHAQRGVVLAEHSDAVDGHRKVAEARRALADAQREAA